MSGNPPKVALAAIRTLTGACFLAWKGSGVPAKEMAARLGVEYGHFVRMFREHDSRHFPPDKIVPLMRECGSLLPLEWMAHQMGYCLHEASLTAILETIRDAMVKIGGEPPRFTICENGRVEAVR